MILAVMNAIYAIAYIEAWKTQDFNWVWTHELAIQVRCSNQLSYEATDVRCCLFVGSNEPVRNECKVIYEIFHILNPTKQNEETDRISFTLTYHLQNLAIKSVILKNFKILRNDLKTKHIFSLPPLISFKRDKNLGNFLVRSAFKFDNQPGTFTCKRTRCKTCPFICNTVNIDPLKSLTILHASPQMSSIA